MAYSYCPYCARELGADQVCGHCGKTPEAYKPQPHHFPVGTVLDQRYWVGSVLGEGGFGITYLGYDAKLERRLAIKEYFPSALVSRTNGSTEVTCYARDQETFNKGKEQFLDEARMLAKLDNIPNIVRVLDYFPANGTAYIVIEFLEGETLKARLKRTGKIAPETLFSLLEPMMTALEKLHQTGLIHRDISPDNIMLLSDGEQVRLMDFGCARDINSKLTMTVMLKPGFAPFEQYSGHEQGPWTDVYALCATMYYCMTGKRLPSATNRVGGDTLQPPSALGVKIDPAQEWALMKGLAVWSKDRWQSVGELWQALRNPKPEPEPTPKPEPKPAPKPQTEQQPTPKKKKPIWLLAVAAVLVVCLGVVLFSGGGKEENTLSVPETTAPETKIPATTVLVNAEKENTLMSVPLSDNPAGEPAFNTEVLREQVASITFLDTLADTPENTVDASQAGNGRVLAWAEEVGNDSYALYIAAEGGVYAPQNSRYLFSGFTYMESIHFGNAFHTSNVTDMAGMFYACSSLTSLDVSGFDTSKVRDMAWMFSGCESLTELDLSSFDTAKVRDMAWMFQFCCSLTELDLSNFDTSNVTDMAGMFCNCRSLTSLDVSGFDTSEVTDMTSMFLECNSLTSLDLSGFDTANVTSMNSMFSACSSLTSLDLSGFDTANVMSMGGMFSNCKSLTYLDVSGFDTSKVLSMDLMFSDCYALTELDVSGFDTANVTSMTWMFQNCISLTYLDVSGFDITKVTDMSDMFKGCDSLTGVDLSRFQ